MPSPIILFLCVGTIANVLVSAQITRALMVRGYRIPGFVLGLSASVIFLGLGQFFIAQDYRSFFSENGHCGTCCELCRLIFWFWWFFWGTDSLYILYLALDTLNRFLKC